MTSTTQGTFTDKNSSRVLRPPGGGSSNIFAFATDDSADQNRKSDSDHKRSVNSSAITPDPQPVQVNNVSNSAEKSSDERVNEGNKDDQENACESSKLSSATGGSSAAKDLPVIDRATLANRGRAGGSNFNILTGEPLNTDQQSSNAATGGRFRQPPGGASTKLW